jgi:peptidoglycan L-alanyl-D-glutamate endopeptidase CwlK
MMLAVLRRVAKRLDGLTPGTREKCELLLILAADQGIPLRLTFTRRTRAEQRALYAQGRETREKVNELRAEAGMQPLGITERNRVATWAMDSKHLDGLAFDVVPMSRAQRLVPEWMSPHWAMLGELGESVGLAWGGRWSKPDRPHFENTEEA